MHHRHTLIPLQATLAAIAIAASGAVHAQLGSAIATGTSTQGSSDASAVVMQNAANDAVQWQESTDANQIRVRQYVSAAGQVYAVSWDGPAMPDLAALLGTWFGEYQQSALAGLPNVSSLHASRVSRSDLVVETAVRLRDFNGRAWLPDALPSGVTAGDIQ
ncbi:DUF2844 domain-containing protein [Caballeronia sp.]|uniref:DUF2844 domain-containing protein n=1 Tax=Caballeronia sp. TaxID=1931223 RepID=UPI003C4DB1A4